MAMLAFGTSEWALRLPNVLAFVVFLVVSLALMRRVSNGVVGTCGFLLLTANPYLLELFSMERGYGLGLAFMTASLLFLLRAQEGSDPAREETFATVCAALAVLSNFTFLLVFGALVLLVVVRRPPRRLADSAPWAIPSILLAAAVTAPLLRLKRSGELYFGGTSGFFQDTVRSLVQLTLAESGAGRQIALALEIAANLTWLDPVRCGEDSGYCNFLFLEPGGLDLGAAGRVFRERI
jgi:4-amino-4-deoxy-L-arabinose transferase-like glycosyltransferase